MFTRTETADRIDVGCDCGESINTSQSAFGRAVADKFPLMHKCYVPKGKKK